MSTSIIAATNPHKGTTTSSAFAFSLDSVIQATITNPTGGLLTPCQVTLQLSCDGGNSYRSIDSKRGGMGDGTPLLLLFKLSDYAGLAAWTHARLVFSGNTATSQLGVTVAAVGDGATWASGGGTGTVTSVSVVTANGYSGTVANPTTTPAITISGPAASAGLTPTAPKTANYTAAPGDFVPIDATGGTVTVTLPAAPADGATVGATGINPTGGQPFLAVGGSDQLDRGGASFGFTFNHQSVVFTYHAANATWYCESDSAPASQLDGRYLGSVAVGRLPTTGLTITQHAGAIGVGAIVSTTATLDLSVFDWYTLTLNIATTTIALSNPTVGQQFTLRLLQDGTGGRLVNWFTTIKWAGGTAPTLTATANKADVFTFKCMSAGQYDGFVVGQNL